jgi:acyl-CoA thioester hydrolase
MFLGGVFMPQASVQIRVPFFDVDSSERIHYTAMLRYMEIAEHELMRSIGFPYATTLLSLRFPRVHVSCDYRGAIRYDDMLTVEARIDHVGRSSWTVVFTGRLMPEGIVATEGKMTIVALDPETERARSLPDELRSALSE